MMSPSVRSCGLFFFALALLAGNGCTSETTQSTAEKRKAASSETVQFIVWADKALERGAYTEALAMADSARKRAPELADTHFLRARSLSKLRRFDKARDAYEKVLSLDPDYQGARLNLANNAFHRSQYRRALALYQEERNRFSTAGVMTRIGRAYESLGKADSALGAYRRALAMDSLQAPAYLGISQIYEEKGEVERALEYSRRAARLDSGNTRYRYKVGEQLFQAGQTREAVKKFEAVVKQRPARRGVQYSLGQALARLGREEEAQLHLDKADSLNKVRSRLKGLRAKARRQPGRAMRWVRLGRMQLRLNRLGEALESLQVALSLAPQSKELQTNVATLLMQKGNLKEAIQRYRAVLQQDPTLADVWLNLGIAYAKVGHKAAARKAWNKTLEYKPSDPAARNYLATLSHQPNES